MSMFTKPAAALATIVLLAPVATARGQQGVDLIAHVPFAFTVGDSQLPSDTYRLSSLDGHPEMLVVRGSHTSLLIRTDEGWQTRDTKPVLVFHKYGDEYFLREVRTDGTERLDLRETKAERAAAEGQADRAEAAMQSVIVAAR